MHPRRINVRVNEGFEDDEEVVEKRDEDRHPGAFGFSEIAVNVANQHEPRGSWKESYDDRTDDQQSRPVRFDVTVSLLILWLKQNSIQSATMSILHNNMLNLCLAQCLFK